MTFGPLNHVTPPVLVPAPSAFGAALLRLETPGRSSFPTTLPRQGVTWELGQLGNWERGLESEQQWEDVLKEATTVWIPWLMKHPKLGTPVDSHEGHPCLILFGWESTSL